MNFFEWLGLSFVILSLVMTATWWFSVRVNNYSVVDAVWAFSFCLLTAIYAVAGDGWAPRRALVFAAVTLWSLRLGLFLARRIYAAHPQEDGRYLALRHEYGADVQKRFFMFFQFQALSVVLLSAPFLLMSQNSAPEWSAIELGGFVLMLLSWLGESLADAQAHKFKANPANRQLTCEVGLWKYSRHPNYFFESCIWWGFYLMALGTHSGPATIYAPLIILFLLLKVTGVPPSEAAALSKRGDVYRDYQRRTSMFIPWFPKK